MINKHTKEIIIKTFCDSRTTIQAIKIAIIVGTILNIINQGDYIFNMSFEKMNFFKMGLTYLVPFFVSSYTAMILTNLTCKRCKSSLHVEQNSMIPECPKC